MRKSMTRIPNNPTVFIVVRGFSRTSADYVMCNKPLEVDMVRYNSVYKEVHNNITSCKYVEQRPQGTSGLTRRYVNLTLAGEGPFSTPWGGDTYYFGMAKSYYAGGTPQLYVVFEVFVAQENEPFVDILTLPSLGVFGVAEGTSFNQRDGTTTISLQDILLLNDSRYGVQDSNGIKDIRESPYSGLLSSRVSVGDSQTKVPFVGSNTINGLVPSTPKPKAMIQGVVKFKYSMAGYLNLGKCSELDLHDGATLKIILPANGECIEGTVYVDGSGDIKLTPTTRNSKLFDTVLTTAPVTGQVLNATIPAGYTAQELSITSFSNKDAVFSGDMFVKFTQKFHPSPATEVVCKKIYTDATELGYTVTPKWRVAGDSPSPLVLENLRTNTNTNLTGASFDYSVGALQATYTGDLAHLNYAKFGAPVAAEVWSRDALAAFTPGSIERGTQWYAFNNGVVNTFLSEYVTQYCRVDISPSDTVKFFYRLQLSGVGPTFLEVDPTHIVSSNSDYYYKGVMKTIQIVLYNKPHILLGVSESDVSSTVFMDVFDPAPVRMNRINKVLHRISQASFNWYSSATMWGDTITSSDYDWAPYLKVLTDDSTVAEMIDVLLFESDCDLVWVHGKVEVCKRGSSTFSHGVWVDGSMLTYYKPIISEPHIITKDQIILDSLSITIGKLGTDTCYPPSGGEGEMVRQAVHFTSRSFDQSKIIQFSGNRAAAGFERKFSYDFKYVYGVANTKLAGNLMLQAGHYAGVTEVPRNYTFDATMDVTTVETGDVVFLKDIDGVSSSSFVKSPIYQIADDGVPYYQYDESTKWMVVPGLCVIDSMEIDLCQDGLVRVSARQVQPAIDANIRGLDSSGDFLATPSINDIPTDPTDPLFAGDAYDPADPLDVTTGPNQPLRLPGGPCFCSEGYVTNVGGAGSDAGNSGQPIITQDKPPGCESVKSEDGCDVPLEDPSSIVEPEVPGPNNPAFVICDCVGSTWRVDQPSVKLFTVGPYEVVGSDILTIPIKARLSCNAGQYPWGKTLGTPTAVSYVITPLVYDVWVVGRSDPDTLFRNPANLSGNIYAVKVNSGGDLVGLSWNPQPITLDANPDFVKIVSAGDILVDYRLFQDGNRCAPITLNLRVWWRKSIFGDDGEVQQGDLAYTDYAFDVTLKPLVDITAS